MKNYHILMAVGLIMAIGGGAIAAAFVMTAFPDPSEKAEWEGNFSYAGGIENVTLDRGDYDVWISDRGDDVRIRILDDGRVIFDESSDDTSDSININGKDYYKLGTFEVDGGNYEVSADGNVDVYITPPIDIFSEMGMMCAGGAIMILGIVLLIIGVIMSLVKPSEKGPYQQPYHPPPDGRGTYRRPSNGYRDPFDDDYRPPTGDYPTQQEYRRERRPPPRRARR